MDETLCEIPHDVRMQSRAKPKTMGEFELVALFDFLRANNAQLRVKYNNELCAYYITLVRDGYVNIKTISDQFIMEHGSALICNTITHMMEELIVHIENEENKED